MNPRKRALLVGINRYKYSVESGYLTSAIRDLQGPREDVRDIHMLLERSFGFEPGDISTLIDEEATRASILERIESHLVHGLGPDDIAVMYFSGHGSFSIEGQERLRHGTLITYDSREPVEHPAADLRGAEIAAVLQRCAARNVTFVIDSCYSGELVQTRGGARIRTVPPHVMEPAAAMDRISSAPRAVSIATQGSPFVLLSAAGPHEPAWETDLEGVWRGAFTYYLAEQLRGDNRDVTYRDMMDKVRGLVNARFLGQHPQLQGTLRDAYVFGNQSIGVAPYFLVRPDGSRVRLDGGKIHGFTRGSTYAVYDPGAKGDFRTHPAVTEIEVTHVESTFAFGKNKTEHPIAPASRAVESTHSYESPQVLVSVCGMPDLIPELGKHRHLKVLPDSSASDPFHLRIQRTAEKIDFEIRAFGNSRSARMEPILLKSATREADLIAECDRWVRHWAKWINLLEIRNESNQANPLTKVRLSVSPAPANEGRDRDTDEFYDDEQVRYTVENNADRDVFLSLLAFGDDGSVAVVYPQGGPSRLLPRDGQCIGILDIEPLHGRQREVDILKAFLTLTPVELQVLELPSFRPRLTRKAAVNPLEELLEDAAFGTRNLKASTAIDEWFTLQTAVSVRTI